MSGIFIVPFIQPNLENKIILDDVVTKVRDYFIKRDGLPIENNTLRGQCELSQAFTYYTLKNANIDVIPCNTKFFLFHRYKHAFALATIDNKEYLLDCTFQQFCLTNYCNKERYFLNNAPDPGYFLSLTPEGKHLMVQLMSRGYIRLTHPNAKLYGDAFVKSTFLDEKDLKYNKNEIDNIQGGNYITKMHIHKDTLKYTEEQVTSLGYNIPL